MGLAAYVSHSSHNTIEYSFVTFKNGVWRSYLISIRIQRFTRGRVASVVSLHRVVETLRSTRTIVRRWRTIPFHWSLTDIVVLQSPYTGIKHWTCYVCWTCHSSQQSALNALPCPTPTIQVLSFFTGTIQRFSTFPETDVSSSFPSYGNIRFYDDAVTVRDILIRNIR
jgi:hypothetical protein